ncbi:MAG: acyl-CoA/acyl-ACP dehydrogenase [Paracoccaceae bacterium]|jgi:acyl-CoA dehydrogenase|nr:acyl-CoA/acyl-ACP dehydrogenase [Paracoccaceae bacterium]|tara:strand:+ start:681 stop:1829 length:1149 start_codon:yes stop_codon:yes gene_type:complete
MGNISAIKSNIAKLCSNYPDQYWRNLDEKGEYPSDFVNELSKEGFLSCLIPEEFGGSGLGLIEAAAILEEVSYNGCNAGACHAQMYVMASILKYGTQEQKELYLPQISSGKLRLQSFGVTEPDSGTDTTNLKTTAKKIGSNYVINGKKVWISRVEYSDIMVLLARTKAKKDCAKKSDGLSAFIIDLKKAIGNGLTVKPIDAMINHHACELFIDDLVVPAEQILGKENDGFQVVLDAMNAERILIAAECIGDSRYFIKKATDYASNRIVFGKPIGSNQGVSFPLARAHANMIAAKLLVEKAANLFDSNEHCGAEANMCKMLASENSWFSGDIAMQTFGGFAFSKDYHIERKFRETRLYQIAPVSTNLILSYIAEHELGLPRSY